MEAGIKVFGSASIDRRLGDSTVDKRAFVHPDSVIGEGSEVGPFAYIGNGVRIGRGCRIHPHSVVVGPTVMGENNEVFPFATIGGDPQDLRYRGEPTRLIIGDGNKFRESVTVSRGTAHGGGVTVVGNRNLLMAYCHVAHDCVLGDNIVMANHGTIAGHATVHDHAVFGGFAAVGAFLRVGESAMLAAGAMVERDVPPFCIVAGNRATLRSVNRVGLDRRGISAEAKQQIKAVFKLLKTKGLSVTRIVESIEAKGSLTAETMRFLDFIRASSRGLTR